MSGRPSSFTQELADKICERIMGGEGVRTICADDGMPDQRTIYRWLSANEAFRQQYAHARDVQADTLADDVLAIADDGSLDIKMTERGPVVDTEIVQRSRLRVDARKWLAGKLAPKKYGDKLELGGSIGVRHEDALSALE